MLGLMPHVCVLARRAVLGAARVAVGRALKASCPVLGWAVEAERGHKAAPSVGGGQPAADAQRSTIQAQAILRC